MSTAHRVFLLMACFVIAVEVILISYYYKTIFDWVSHNLWIIIIPFVKTIIKKLIVLKFVLFFKALGILLFNLSKLLLLKVIKTLTLRYGVFFTQRKWRWARWCKVMFLRRGKQLFRSLNKFWGGFRRRHKWFIFIAFFPVVIILFFFGLSFNITRKTMVQKTQETAIFKTAISARNSSNGIRAWVSRLDQKVLRQIKALTFKK